mmetsp:Transcript_72947/g.116347  ORF Transcript_72947/g.116347 Transcript_72947/m.116347 type:complete len:425 (+) Transcript_72947:76-1350(+)|eukprot:CAMPEP_0197037266 /NCGR_PEP_ID=MMETSP1384-20130603/14518_1 /TAXON_ID=29189 /ORGANISM="Ammonia sp." /LENGTH=424 /DNA_ID=CAMNT_0042467543 /DNA_START=76 /DNA_END=1350 /DNA_ORIENTATION=-
MSIPNLFILNGSGDVLIEKHYLPITKRSVVELFWEEVSKQDKQTEVAPIITTENYYLISIRRSGLFFLSAVNNDVSPLLILEAQHSIFQTFVLYFNNKITESILRENFALIYQLLDEIIIGGFPHTTEMNQLMDMISLPSMVSKIRDYASGSFQVKQTLPSAFHNAKTPWRKTDCKYVTNEIKIDLVEAIDCILQASQSGGFKSKAVTSFVNGSLECSVHLTGQPDLTLNFNTPRMLSHVQLHRCVRISRWQKERIISFVPPDGKFTLLKYRLPNAGNLPLDISPHIRLSKNSSSVKIDVTKTAADDKQIDKVLLEIPFPAETLSFSLSANHGKVTQDEITKVVRWHVGRFPSKEKIVTLEGTVAMPSDWEGSGAPNVRVGFEIKGLSLTNLRVDSLAVHNVKYKPFKGVRHITKAGTFLIRSA